MNHIIHLFILMPLVGFLLSLMVPKYREKLIGQVAFYSMVTQLFTSILFIVIWAINGAKPINLKDVSLYHEKSFDFHIDFYFDHVTAVFLLVGTMISFVVVTYSRQYMHKEDGYKRFYNTILFFWFGYVLTIWSGNFGTLFIGWELLGLSSFLLIAFYRTRYLPVKNAIKVFSVYRLGDIGILMTLWASHHLWHQNILFMHLSSDMVQETLANEWGMGFFMASMVLIAAIVKSAQFPFSSWLPRAMEGPTPSSAIFYGALSVHMGAFMLLRTAPLWQDQTAVRWMIAGVGLLTFLLSNLSSQMQSTIKGKIAYSSTAQIGLIFFEIALGFHMLALIHFAGNAFLRSYQLLISPSVATYLIRDQFYNFKAQEAKTTSRFMNTIRLWALKEWNLEKLQYFLIFGPIKTIGKVTMRIPINKLLILTFVLYYSTILLVYGPYQIRNQEYSKIIAIVVGIVGLMLVSRAYNEKSRALHSWLLLILVHLTIDLSVTFNDHLNLKESAVYLSGILISGLSGGLILLILENKIRKTIQIRYFNGLVTKYPVLAFGFLLSCLGMAGFPITTTFLGEDLLLAHIKDDEILLAFLVAVIFIINGIAVIKMYSRVFLGSQEKTYNSSNHLTL